MKELQVARVQTTHIVDLRQQRTAFFTVYTGTDKRMRTFRVSKGAGVWFSFDGGRVRHFWRSAVLFLVIMFSGIHPKKINIYTCKTCAHSCLLQ